jgi:transposase
VALQAWVQEKPDLTLDELVEKYHQDFAVRVSQSAMSRTLLRLNLVRKKKSFHASERDTAEVKQERSEYRTMAVNLDPQKLVFIDESGSRIGMTRDYGRDLPGKRVTGDRPASYGGNVTMIGALGLNGMRAMMTIGGSATGEVFELYVRDLLRPTLNPGDIVIMDNLSVHQVSGIRELIEGCGAKLVYLPPYSPDFNPIEECWSKLKSILKSMNARTRDALEEAIAKAMRMIKKEDCLGWFADCGYAV